MHRAREICIHMCIYIYTYTYEYNHNHNYNYIITYIIDSRRSRRLPRSRPATRELGPRPHKMSPPPSFYEYV